MANSFGEGVRKMWAAYKNVAAGRGLLQWIGLWDWSMAAVGALITWGSAWTRHLSGAEQFVLALAAFALILLIVVLIKFARAPVEPSSVRQSIGKIEFDYLPAKPTDNGWTRAYKEDGAAVFSTDHDIYGSLRMEVEQSEFAMDHPVPAHAVLADHLIFTAKYNNSTDPGIMTMIFVRLKVSARNGTNQKEAWFKFYHGHKFAKQTTGNVISDQKLELPEQTIHWPARPLSNGSMEFHIDLREAVRMALGEAGWIYQSSVKVRLRGNLSISPIEFSTQ
jgi:hypothetical protein